MTRLLRKRGGFYCDLEELSLHLLEDIRAYKRNDPAARSAIEVVLLYNGLHATIDYRIAHWFYRHRCFFIARAISQWSKMWTGIEIHPGAQIGRRLVIDHGTGIVIGETTQIGDDCLLYQGVTLGGTGKDVGKRHPTLSFLHGLEYSTWQLRSNRSSLSFIWSSSDPVSRRAAPPPQAQPGISPRTGRIPPDAR